MSDSAAKVFVVEDDPSLRNAIARLAKKAGIEADLFESAEQFLESVVSGESAVSHESEPSHAGAALQDRACLILDVQLPGLDGLALQERLAEEGLSIPVIFITGHGDIPMSVKAMKQGAIDFLQKPFDAVDLIEAIRLALERSEQGLEALEEARGIKVRLDRLTPREREVFDLVTEGYLNKQVAGELGISEKTVKVHRGRVMEKMGVKSLAELARFAERARS